MWFLVLAPHALLRRYGRGVRSLAKRWGSRQDGGVLAQLMLTEGAWIAVAVGGVLGCIFQWRLRRQDDHTWVLARAPELPIRALSVGDDAWLRGKVRSDNPLSCPWFDVACVSYHYEIEKKVTSTYKDSKGKRRRRTSWQTEATEQRDLSFELDDGERILVHFDGATNEALTPLQTSYETSRRRHSASVIRVGTTISVLGVTGEKNTFGRRREVPLLLTRKKPAARVRSSHGSESWLFFFCYFAPFLAGCVAGALLAGDAWANSPSNIAITIGTGLALAVPFWTLATYNRLVRLRQQVHAGFRQVDVDLAVRSGLIPNLVAVVKAACNHEQDLLTKLARIRTTGSAEEATEAEPNAAATARQVLLLHEAYPELRTDDVYRDLHERLWAVEEKLAHSRQLYNNIVREWNDRTQSFPAVMLAKLCGYREAPPFARDGASVPPPLRDHDATDSRADTELD
ncbi:MAG: LemA protein [Planctomycetota bacterium]|jgi:LemA protein